MGLGARGSASDTLARLSTGLVRGWRGEVPEWSKGTDCKSVGEAFGGSNPPLPTSLDGVSFIKASCRVFGSFLVGGWLVNEANGDEGRE